MNFIHPALLTALGLIAIGLLVAAAVHLFSPEAKRERRRRRSHSRIVAKVKRPMVSFRVRTKK